MSTWAAFVYGAFIPGLFSRRTAASSMSKRTDVMVIPLPMALWQRDRDGPSVVVPEPIDHSGASSRYASIRLTERLDLDRVAVSIGLVGDAYDDAFMESCNGFYKSARIFTWIFRDRANKGLLDVECAPAG